MGTLIGNVTGLSALVVALLLVARTLWNDVTASRRLDAYTQRLEQSVRRLERYCRRLEGSLIAAGIPVPVPDRDDELEDPAELVVPTQRRRSHR